MDKPYTVLGTYTPEVYDFRIRAELRAFTARQGLHSHPELAGDGISVRGPDHISHGNVKAWHHDANQILADTLGIVLWSSETPTEILGSDGTVYQPAPFEVVLIRNSEVHHRQPDTIGTNRWFYRQFVLLDK